MKINKDNIYQFIARAIVIIGLYIMWKRKDFIAILMFILPIILISVKSIKTKIAITIIGLVFLNVVPILL